MSYTMTLAPAYYVPHYGAYAAANAMTSVSGTMAASQTATALTVASTAFASAALPVAVAVLGVLAAGMTVEAVRQDRAMKRQNVVELPTVFTCREKLIDALFACDSKKECEIYDDVESDTITARFRLEDYIFRMNEETGCYDLTVKNAGTCRQVLEQINALQDEYCRAVRRTVIERLYESVQRNGWVVESDVEDEEETRVISIIV